MKHLGKPITQRQLRVGEMIKQALGNLFIRDEAKIPNLSTREVTVTEVRMSQDLKTAKIFVMPLGGKNTDETIEKRLRRFDKEMKYKDQFDTLLINNNIEVAIKDFIKKVNHITKGVH